MIRRRFSFSAIICLTVCTQVFAQASGGSVSGHVFCDDGDFPARNAKVKLVPVATLLPHSGKVQASMPKSSEEVPTDRNGLYLIRNVSIGSYVVSATQDGYMPELKIVRERLERLSAEDQVKLVATLQTIHVTSGGELRQDVVIRRAGAISGRVMVDSGGPALGAQVTVDRVLSPIDSGSDAEEIDFSQFANVDDRGVYRVAGLIPGKYSVTTYFGYMGLSTVYAPGVLQKADAHFTSVDSGEELPGVDITIPTGLLHNVSGVVLENGTPVAGAYLTIHPGPQSKGADHDSSFQTGSGLDGSYHFPTLPPGTYTIVVRRPANRGSIGAIGGRLTIQVVDRDVVDANLNLLSATPAKQ